MFKINDLHKIHEADGINAKVSIQYNFVSISFSCHIYVYKSDKNTMFDI